MSLSAIVAAIGGELYDHGRRAVVPGPGHSRSDRSVSLWLCAGRVVVHSFGRSTWTEVMRALRDRGLVDAQGRPKGGSGGSWSTTPPRSGAERIQAATLLWSQASPITRQLSLAHIRRRGIMRPPPVSAALRHHSQVPISIYAGRGPRLPALLSAVNDDKGALCAVEVTYLDPNGARALALSISRKIVGVLPLSTAVRLDDPGRELLVGEGVFTTLSACARFGLPGWALLSTRNLRTWSPPTGVHSVLIAADRGEDGERSARRLEERLQQRQVSARIALPPVWAADWNDARPADVGGGQGRARSAPRALTRAATSPDEATQGPIDHGATVHDL